MKGLLAVLCYLCFLLEAPLFVLPSFSTVVAGNIVPREETWELSVLVPLTGVVPPYHLLTLRTGERELPSSLEVSEQHTVRNEKDENIVFTTIEPLSYSWLHRALFFMGEYLGFTAAFPFSSFSSLPPLCSISLSAEQRKGDLTPLSFKGYWEKVKKEYSSSTKAEPEILALYEDGCSQPLLYFPFPVSESPYAFNLRDSWLGLQQDATAMPTTHLPVQGEVVNAANCRALPWKELGATAVRLRKSSFVVIFEFDASSATEARTDFGTTRGASNDGNASEDSNARCYIPIQGVRLEGRVNNLYFGTVFFTIALLLVLSALRSKFFIRMVHNRMESKGIESPRYGGVKNPSAAAFKGQNREELRHQLDELIARMMQMDKQKKYSGRNISANI